MSFVIRQSTAVDVGVGPFLDQTDGFTPETALTLTQADIRLKKNSGNWAQKNAAQTLTHEEFGWYELSLDTTDTNTVGILLVSIQESGALPVWHEFQVVEETVYDALYTSGAAGYGVSQSGDSFARLGAPAGASVSADIAAIESQTDDIGVAGAGLTAIPWNASWDAEVESEATDALNAYDPPTRAEATSDVNSVLNVLGALNIAAATGDPGTTTTITAYIKQLVNILIGTSGIATFPSSATPANAVSLAEVIRQIYDEVANIDGAAIPAAAPTAAAVADAVWDEALSGHLGAGTAGEALDAAGTAGDPWTTALPGSYSAGQAGYLIGTNVNATVSSRATQTSVDNVQSDTDNIQTRLPAALAGGRMDSSIGAVGADVITAASLDAGAAGEIADAVWDELMSGHAVAGSTAAQLTTIDDFLDTEVAAIKAKTDQLTFGISNAVDANVTGISADTTAADRLEAVMDGTLTGAVNDAGATTTTWICSGLSPGANDRINGRLLTFISGALAGEQTAIVDWVNGTNTIVVTALTAAPANGSNFVIT